MCSQIAVAVAVDGLPTHAATDLFNLSQLNRSSLIVTMSDLASDDEIAHQISENSDQQQPQQRPASCGGGCGCWIEDRCRGWGPNEFIRFQILV